MAVSCMCDAFGHNYRNSSFIVDLAMGQIPRSTERISSFEYIYVCKEHVFGTIFKTHIIGLVMSNITFHFTLRNGWRLGKDYVGALDGKAKNWDVLTGGNLTGHYPLLALHHRRVAASLPPRHVWEVGPPMLSELPAVQPRCLRSAEDTLKAPQEAPEPVPVGRKDFLAQCRKKQPQPACQEQTFYTCFDALSPPTIRATVTDSALGASLLAISLCPIAALLFYFPFTFYKFYLLPDLYPSMQRGAPSIKCIPDIGATTVGTGGNCTNNVLAPNFLAVVFKQQDIFTASSHQNAEM